MKQCLRWGSFIIGALMCVCSFAESKTQEALTWLKPYPSNSQYLDKYTPQKNILCIDVGNTFVKLGFFDGQQQWKVMAFESKCALDGAMWEDALKSVRDDHRLGAGAFESVRVSSVKPAVNEVVRDVVSNVLQRDAVFLNATNGAPLKILLDHPEKLGSDMIAASLAVRRYFPQAGTVVSMFGTATVVLAVNTQNEFLGACIMPGMGMSFHALHQNTAQLGLFEAVRPQCVLGRNTKDAIQSGVYYMQLGGVQSVMSHFQNSKESTTATQWTKVAAGGNSLLFTDEAGFDAKIPDLVVQGLLWMNAASSN